MPEGLNIGARLRLPVDVVTRTAVVVGQKGTGKTSTAVVMLEEAADAGARFGVIDPTGAWYGLRSSADGNGPGLDCVIMCGFNGDVPLSADAGEIAARLVVEEGYNVVCDLEAMPRSDQVRFVADFATVAYQHCRSAVTLVIDEARRFVPQSGAKLEEEGQRCRLALVDVVQLGRRKGLGSILIGQRMTNIAADAREQADLVIAHRLLGVNDRKTIAGWLEDAGADASDVLEQIPRLRVGHAAVLAPEQNVLAVYKIREKRTFDSSAAPEIGTVMLAAPKGRASIDLSALEAKMGHALEAAREDDPATLRKRIYQLERELAAGGGASQADLDAARAAGRAEAAESAERRLLAVKALIRPLTIDSQRLLDAASEALLTLRDECGLDERLEPAQAAASHAPHPDPPPLPTRDDRGHHPAPAGGGSEPEPPAQTNGTHPALKAGAKRMLAALMDAPRPLTRGELATVADVRLGGTMSEYLSACRRYGLLDESDGRVALADTPATAQIIGRGNGHPRSPEDVIAPHLPKLKAGARRMLDLLMRAPDRGYTRSELSGLAGVTKGGTFSEYLSSLRKRGLIEERARRIYPGSVIYLWQR